MRCKREDKHKRRKTKSKVCESCCSWIFTLHFSASESREIASSHKVTLQKEEHKIDFAERLLKRYAVILEGMRPANDKNRQCPCRDREYAAFSLSQQMRWEPSTVSAPGSPDCQTCRKAKSKVRAPASGGLKETDVSSCLRFLGAPQWSQCWGRMVHC